jgi:hypothetical protein
MVKRVKMEKYKLNLIGISGLAGSGKSTVADIILENPNYIAINLADPIKRFAMDVWGFSEEQVFGPSQFRNAPDPRYETSPGNFLNPRLTLQTIGTQGVRAIDDNAWIRYAIRVAKTLLEAKPKEYCYSSKNGLDSYIEQCPQGEFERIEGFPAKVFGVVIGDCRFRNELKSIREAGGKLIRVIRPGAGLQGSFGLHQSEAEMSEIPDSEFDVIIQNTGTLEDLKKSLHDFISKNT